MALDPALAQKLRAHDDEEVRRGGSILEGCEGVCDDSAPRKCQDCAWALLFLLTVGCMVLLASDPKAQKKFAHNSKYMEPCIVAIVSSVIFAKVMLQVSKLCTTTFVYLALFFVPAIKITVGLLLICSDELGLNIIGFVLIAIGLCGLCCIYCMRRYIPFTVLIIRTTTSVIDTHFGMVAVAFLGCCLMFAWGFLCYCAHAAIYLLHAKKINKFKEDVPAAGLVILFFTSLIQIWGACVVTNTIQVACHGVFARWYFGKDNAPGAMPVLKSTQVAFTTSFGSICFGSLAVAVFQAARIVVRRLRQEATEDCNMVMIIICMVLESIIQCIGNIVEWFCTYAYVQCATRGLGLLDAARGTYALCTYSNIGSIISSSLVDPVIVSMSLLSGMVGATAAWQWLGSEVWPVILGGFVLGCMAGNSALQPVRSGAVTIAVCWAEFPQALRTLRPELHNSFCQAAYGRSEQESVRTVEMQAPATGPGGRLG